ncbi:MAG: HIT family protein [Candidatus Paceibacterota bacterium]
MSTVFEKIIAGEIPCYKVYEDDETFAFLDADPINPGHTLVIPKEPHKDIYEIPEASFLAVMRTVHKLAPVIREAVGADGINIGQNNEPAAGQEVFHFHVHIMPRFEGDGHTHWQGAENYHEGEDGEKIANQIAERL